MIRSEIKHIPLGTCRGSYSKESLAESAFHEAMAHSNPPGALRFSPAYCIPHSTINCWKYLMNVKTVQDHYGLKNIESTIAATLFFKYILV